MATITGQRARSTLPPCDTPGVKPIRAGSPDGLSRDRRRGRLAMRSRPRSPVLRTSGSRATAAALTRPGTPARCPPSLRTSRARCRSTIPARAPGGCWRLTLTRAASATVSPTSSTRRPSSASCSSASAAGPRRRLAVRRPPRLRPVRRGAAVARAARRRPGAGAALPRDRPGADVLPRRPDQPAWLPAQVRRLAGALDAAGATPGRPSSTRTGRRCGPRCWPSSRPSCARSNDRQRPRPVAGRGRAGRRRRPVGSPPRRPRPARR